MRRSKFIIEYAEDCKDDPEWFERFLSKEYANGICKITADDLAELLSSGRLQPWQKEMIKEAVKPGSDVAKRLIALRSPAGTPMVDALIRKHKK